MKDNSFKKTSNLIYIFITSIIVIFSSSFLVFSNKTNTEFFKESFEQDANTLLESMQRSLNLQIGHQIDVLKDYAALPLMASTAMNLRQDHSELLDFFKSAKILGRRAQYKVVDLRGETIVGTQKNWKDSKESKERWANFLITGPEKRFSFLEKVNNELYITTATSIKFQGSTEGILIAQSPFSFGDYLPRIPKGKLLIISSYSSEFEFGSKDIRGNKGNFSIIKKLKFSKVQLTLLSSLESINNLNKKNLRGIALIVLLLSIITILIFRKIGERIFINPQRQLKLALETRTNFMENISHEIRTPMNGIMGMVSSLEIDLKKENNIEKVRIIKNCCHSLMGLVHQIIDFTKLEKGDIKLEKVAFSLTNSILDIVLLMSEKAKNKNIKINFDRGANHDIYIISDISRIKQFMSSIIDNAIKYSDSGEINISLVSEVLEDKSSIVYISVKDNGIGIEKERFNTVFEPFERSNKSKLNNFESGGLSLPIAKTIVEALGGRIDVSSEVSIGSEFIISFPVETVPLTAKENIFVPVNKEFANQFPLNILVVDDNNINILVAKAIFETNLGYSIRTAVNGEEALKCVREGEFDLVFMDCHMPVLNGYDATRIIKTLNQEHIPIVVALTAGITQEDKDKCIDAGMDSFLAKPLLVDELVLTIKKSFLKAEKKMCS